MKRISGKAAKDLSRRLARRAMSLKLYTILLLLATFLSIPYFLAALNINVSQVFLFKDLFVEVHPGIHHGLIGYVTFLIGVSGLQASARVEHSLTRRYLFLISFFFIVKGMFIFAHDWIGEQVAHQTMEEVYAWDWKAPQIELFTLSAVLISIKMENTRAILAMSVPVLLVSVFTNPFIAVGVGYLVLLLVYVREEVGETPWLVKEVEEWKFFRRSFRLIWFALLVMCLVILLAELGVKL
jgi:hypothetical protein